MFIFILCQKLLLSAIVLTYFAQTLEAAIVIILQSINLVLLSTNTSLSQF